ncbi:G-type lectin S-receptor-like serine/threonine-protein kinase0 [Salvia divinorum]|uniref:non-specific serine/threonine protein kinase n=1 Tax=Salvia divinorum TaxID=28513 RepID=A0ABD1IEF0_SALDI
MISVEDAYNSTAVIRTKLDPFGTLMRLTLNAERDKWYRVYTFPQDTCNEYGVCGPNGICKSRTDSPVRCQCFKGFSPKFQNYWDLQDWSGGCTRIKLLNCHGGDGFLEVGGVKYPDMLSFRLNRNMSLGECNAECLKNCSCTAYANPFITNGGSGCLMWFNELIDTKELSTADSKQNIYIRVPVSELDLSISLEDEKENKRPIKLILISIVSGVLISALINGGVLLLARLKRQAKRKGEDLELPMIKIETIIVQATNNFSTENMIGVGGFGPVYKGNMPSEEEIAVKRLSRSSYQGLEEFRNEVMVICR